eukprot:3151687-Pyramimonas_sp.AAC.1
MLARALASAAASSERPSWTMLWSSSYRRRSWARAFLHLTISEESCCAVFVPWSMAASSCQGSPLAAAGARVREGCRLRRLGGSCWCPLSGVGRPSRSRPHPQHDVRDG